MAIVGVRRLSWASTQGPVARAAAVAGLLTAALIVAPQAGADIGSNEPEAIPSPELTHQLLLANTGGKRVCGTTLATDGRSVLYAVRLPASSIGPDRTGLYRRDTGSGVEELLTTPSETPRLDCGIASGDGSVYAFVGGESGFTDPGPGSLGALAVFDVHSGVTTVATVAADGTPLDEVHRSPLEVSDDGRYVFFISANDQVRGQQGYHEPAAYRYDTRTGAIRLATPGIGDAPPDSAVEYFTTSADGEKVAFETFASNVVPGVAGRRVYVHDLRSGNTTLISRRDGHPEPGSRPHISADGSRVIYEADGYPPPPGRSYTTTQLVGADLVTGERELVSRTSSGVVANDSSSLSGVSGDGRFVLFTSRATNLVDGITYPPPSSTPPPLSSYSEHLYLTDTHSHMTTLITRSAGAARPANGGGGEATVDEAGDVVVFGSQATDLVAGYDGPDEGSALPQVYAYQRTSGVVRLVSHTAASTTEPDHRPADGPLVSARGHRVVFTRPDQFIAGLLPYLAALDLPRPTVTVTAPSASRPHGAAIPATFEPIVMGLGFGDSALDVLPICTSTAGPEPDAGLYPITCVGAADPDYDVSYVSGALTITPAPTSLETQSPSLAQSAVSRSVAVSARLTSIVTGGPVPDAYVRFTVGSQSCSALTDSNGVGTCSLADDALVPLLRGERVTATYPGNRNYESSSGTARARPL